MNPASDMVAESNATVQSSAGGDGLEDVNNLLVAVSELEDSPSASTPRPETPVTAVHRSKGKEKEKEAEVAWTPERILGTPP